MASNQPDHFMVKTNDGKVILVAGTCCDRICIGAPEGFRDATGGFGMPTQHMSTCRLAD